MPDFGGTLGTQHRQLDSNLDPTRRHDPNSGLASLPDPSVTPPNSDVEARLEAKRSEHERQRAAQRKAFEEQMAMLEAQQRQEEANLLAQRASDGSPSAVGSSATAPNNASAPATPPFSAHGSGANSPLAQRSRPGSVLLDRDSQPEEGLNGSNVPGLHPPPGPARSVPGSRRISTGPEELTGASANANRRSAGNDLAGAFERMGLEHRSINQVRAQLQQEPQPQQQSGTRSAGPASTGAGNFASPQMQRVLSNRSLNESGQGAGGDSGMTPVFNERFLFDDELDAEDAAFVKKYNLQEDDDKFPVLIRRDSFPGMLSASSAALDLAPLSQTPPRFPRGGNDSSSSNGNGGGKLSEWPQFSNNQSQQGQGQQSRDENGQVIGADRRGHSERNSPRLGPGGSSASSGASARQSTMPLPSPGGNRIPSIGRTDSPGLAGQHRNAGPIGGGQGGLRSGSALDGTPRSASGPRFPSSTEASQQAGAGAGQQQQGSKIGASAQTGLRSTSTSDPRLDGPGAATDGFPSFAIDGFSSRNAARPFKGYGGAGPFDSRAPNADRSRPSSGYFDAFGPAVAGLGGPGVGKAGGYGMDDHHGALGMGGRPSNGRKGELDVNAPLEDLQGEIFALCKDQHGCRYLQKKLEEGVPAYRDMIFAETFSHFAELMTDPFGNYLCQKMLEYCTDEQRNLIVESVAGELVGISLNMHGTRAVQKTIDFLSTPRQIHSIIMALSMNVVTLIKDLNGNHVVQKCLNRLSAENNQFIYNAVAAHCVEVATHRHGCCVLQRCIDHASESQRMQLVTEITLNALTLVQDPFGNYVVQYILDLNDSRYSDAVIRQFVGNVCLLSVQKFSSNVIEKCIRVSDPPTRKTLIDELLNRQRLEKLLRDSFANYVVQTSLDYADPVQRMQLVECIRPILPMIRNTPYGKRIQSKLQRDNIDVGGGHHRGGGGGGAGGAGIHGGMPYGMLPHQQQLHAMGGMRGPPGADFMGAGPGGMGPYGAGANLLAQQGAGHFGNPAHLGGPGAGYGAALGGIGAGGLGGRHYGGGGANGLGRMGGSGVPPLGPGGYGGAAAYGAMGYGGAPLGPQHHVAGGMAGYGLGHGPAAHGPGAHSHGGHAHGAASHGHGGYSQGAGFHY